MHGTAVKKTAIGLMLILALFVSSLVGVESVKLGMANFVPASSLRISSPKNATYNSNPLIVYYFATFVMVQTELVTYSSDGKANVTILNKPFSDLWETISGNITLQGLSEGSHHLELYSSGLSHYGNLISGYAEVYFSIDTVAPSISILIVESKTYNTGEISLKFTVNEATSWMGFSLDNQTAIAVGGNTTLRDLSQGSHSLVVYANDIAGNMGASETIYFTITDPFLTNLFIAFASAVAIAVIGLLVYIKRFHRNKSP
jgi:hypothetical protein